jgi:(p)ppGpp synthase/HD superfamily hydrolase
MRPANNLLELAIRVALEAHRGQTYPSPEQEPYILHPIRVMLSVNGNFEQITAVLHDVVEDTRVTLDQLRSEGFPASVLHALDHLTQRSGEEYSAYIERVASDGLATEVKVADICDNLRNNRRLARTPDVVARLERYERALTRLAN